MTDPDMGTWNYTAYDALGNLLAQTDARSCTTTLAYDHLNRLTGKSYSGGGSCATAAVTYTYDGSLYNHDFNVTSLPAGWTSAGNVTFSGGQAHLTGAGDWNTNLYRSGPVADGQGAHFLFKLNRTDASAKLYLRHGTYQTADYRRWGLVIAGGRIYREYQQGTGAPNSVDLMELQANVWYEAHLGVDSAGQFRVVIWQRDHPDAWAERSDALAAWNYSDWRFITQVHTGTEDLEYYQEYAAGAVGQRSGMTDGSGSTAWTYDRRGRVLAETKVVNGAGGGTFVTRWGGYNAADLPTTLTYPDGEVLTYNYYRQKALNSVQSNANGTLVQATFYDEAGRVDLRLLGTGANALHQDYEYHLWTTQGGRLQTLKTGTSAFLTALQNLEYNYDAHGNVNWIKDYKAGTQTQSFTYDDLDRLDYTSVTGGDGQGAYTEDNAYDANGRLTARGGATLGYAAQSASCPDGALAKANAATTAGANSYCYDRNGNQVRRTIGGTTYTLTYDASASSARSTA
jgi:YD repeat-containing protein